MLLRSNKSAKLSTAKPIKSSVNYNQRYSKKLIKSTLFFFVILVFLCNTGCKENTVQPVNPVITQNYIWPLAVGNIWVYNTKEYAHDGSIIKSTVDTLKIVSDTTINGILWYKPNYASFYLRNNEWGLNIFENDSIGEQHGFKYPADVNFTFIRDTIIFGSNIGDTLISGYRIDRIDTLITVPAGTFSCYHYRNFTRTPAGVETDDWKNDGETWYSPGYGWIKGIDYIAGNVAHIDELIYIELK